ncbi:hypothetical protein VNI00_003178 [Paramarasmius palmivorus]|uniref:Uncharacterized protein n=1 Tax=Paramarasmius palmivorus TaxID=297713 RepID=A0AAW0DTX2_9AGAR
MPYDLVATRSAVAKISTGKQVNEDSWMTMWCSTNWGDLLQPAPLSIALLGSIMIISASTDDFSLVNADDPVPYVWEFAKLPGSFKACLMQMARAVNEGYTAFGSAHKNMTRIQNSSSQIPDVIKTAVVTILKGSPQEVNAYLPGQIQAALELAQICAGAAKDCELKFHGISNLAGELVVACTNQVGTSEQKLKAKEVQLGILEERKKSEEERVAAAKEAKDLMKKSFENAEEDFHSAVKNVPSGWDLVGMQAVESLTQLAVSAGNAAIGMATLKSQAAMAGIGMLQHTTGTDPNNPKKNPGAGQDSNNNTAPVQSAQATRASAAAITDPGALEVHRVLSIVTALQVLVTGGPSGGPDWDKIRGWQWRPSGFLLIGSGGNKPISGELLPIMDTAVSTISSIIQVANSARASDAGALDKFKPTIEQSITSLQQLVTKANLVLQQTGATATGPATPPTPSKAETSSNTAKLAVENAKFQVDQTRANLEASRESYNKATDQLIKQQEEMSKTIASLTSLKLTSAGLQAMLPVLKKAVGAFTTLQAQFSQITQFFESVASLLGDVLKPSVERWADTMEKTATLRGVSVSALARQLVYTQMMLPLRVSMLAEKISTTYLTVSDRYILPAQRSVGGMMQFSDDTSEQGRAALRAKLEKAQRELQQRSDEASRQIRDLVAADQKQFTSAIDKRLGDIQVALQNVLPAITQPVPNKIKEITSVHVDKVTEYRAEAAKENPMNDASTSTTCCRYRYRLGYIAGR